MIALMNRGSAVERLWQEEMSVTRGVVPRSLPLACAQLPNSVENAAAYFRAHHLACVLSGLVEDKEPKMPQFDHTPLLQRTTRR